MELLAMSAVTLSCGKYWLCQLLPCLAESTRVRSRYLDYAQKKL